MDPVQSRGFGAEPLLSRDVLGVGSSLSGPGPVKGGASLGVPARRAVVVASFHGPLPPAQTAGRLGAGPSFHTVRDRSHRSTWAADVNLGAGTGPGSEDGVVGCGASRGHALTGGLFTHS